MRRLLPLLLLLATVAAGPAERPEPMVLFIYDLRRPALVVPRQWAEQSISVIQCESTWNPDAEEPTTHASGLLQIAQVHRGAMAAAGLNYEDEGDRIKWGISMWERDGRTWRQWECASEAGR